MGPGFLSGQFALFVHRIVRVTKELVFLRIVPNFYYSTSMFPKVAYNNMLKQRSVEQIDESQKKGEGGWVSGK